MTKSLENNPFFRVEQRVGQEQSAKAIVPKLGAIQELNKQKWLRDYDTSRLVRKRFREEKDAGRDAKRREEVLKDRLAVDLKLGNEREEDRLLAKNLVESRLKEADTITMDVKRLRAESIFSSQSKRKRKR